MPNSNTPEERAWFLAHGFVETEPEILPGKYWEIAYAHDGYVTLRVDCGMDDGWGYGLIVESGSAPRRGVNIGAVPTLEDVERYLQMFLAFDLEHGAMAAHTRKKLKWEETR